MAPMNVLWRPTMAVDCSHCSRPGAAQCNRRVHRKSYSPCTSPSCCPRQRRCSGFDRDRLPPAGSCSGCCFCLAPPRRYTSKMRKWPRRAVTPGIFAWWGIPVKKQVRKAKLGSVAEWWWRAGPCCCCWMTGCQCKCAAFTAIRFSPTPPHVTQAPLIPKKNNHKHRDCDVTK